MKWIFGIFLSFACVLFCEEHGHTINFKNVPIEEFIRYVSKVARVNFVFDEELLDFDVSVVSGKPVTAENIVHALESILEKREIKLIEKRGYYHLIRMSKEELDFLRSAHTLDDTKLSKLAGATTQPSDFFIYKLKFHQGSEILETLKGIAAQMGSDESKAAIVESIKTLQWVKGTNSLLYSGPGYRELKKLINTLDVAQKQVFIEVLVIETSVRDGLEFGLEWGSSGKYRNKLGYGFGNFRPTPNKSSFAKSIQGVSPSSPPSGELIPLGRGFDFGVIGDIILHNGLTFFNLGALVSALQSDGKATIILNQKIITQDNKTSDIFVGDNIPFAGSVVETIGASQQTTSNIEYRDVGVSLKITPMLGDDDIITLDIKEEISEAREDLRELNTQLSGIKTSKTNMVTRAHVPNEHFLVLSGMVRNQKVKRKTGIPCLGGLPVIGALFSKTKTEVDKRNVIIFVRPQIIDTAERYKQITQNQEEKLWKSDPSIEAALPNFTPPPEQISHETGQPPKKSSSQKP